MKRLNTEAFIQKAREVHGDKYGYDKVNYIDTGHDVIITCLIHGDFPQNPSRHLVGCGCKHCSHRSWKRTTEEFISEAKIVHGDKYNYDKVNYISNSHNVIITCPIHGDFPQNPTRHLAGGGCRKCTTEINANKRRLTVEIFIEKAKAVHGDKYSYDNVVYVNNTTHVFITCPIHGDFPTQPSNHLMGKGCAKCNGGGFVRTNNDFIRKANEVHDNKYDYSKSNYVGNNVKVIITCPLHGDFPQQPSSHLNGSGCPICVGRGITWLPYEELKIIIHPLKLKSKQEYWDWWDENMEYCKEMGIPKRPEQYYKKAL